MDPDNEKKLTQAILETVKPESMLNREGDQLPFGYFNPATEGNLVWMCNHDAEGRLTQVYSMDLKTHRDKKVGYLDSIEDAIATRDELIKHGWQPMKAPQVEFTSADDGKPLTRKQKRYLQRKLKQMDKQSNPFLDK